MSPNLHNRIVAAGLLLSMLSATSNAQSGSDNAGTRHFGYSPTDELVQCIQRVYGKLAASSSDIRTRLHHTYPCPTTREALDDLLQGEVAKSLIVPAGEPFGIHLFETPDWVYIIPARWFTEVSGTPDYSARQRWKRIRIKTSVSLEAGSGIAEAAANTLIPEVLKSARMIFLQPPVSPIPNDQVKDDEIEIGVRFRFYEASLGRDAPDSVVAVMDQWPYESVGRLVYGELHKGIYKVFWDSPLLNSRGNVEFQDVNGDGWKEIVWRSATCGAQNCIPQQIVIFDKSGREITRQKDCNTSSARFDESDGVCAIEGESIQFAVISAPPPASFDEKERAPKDIIVANWYANGKDAIFTLKSGVYILSDLDTEQFSAKLAADRKAKAIAEAVGLNEEGVRLMKEARYQEAADKFESAAFADDTALYANNFGFALYKLGKYESSVWWLQKSIRLDSKRSIAYFNLGDALGKLNRNTEARQAYTKYLELAPNSKSASDVKAKLAALPPSP